MANSKESKGPGFRNLRSYFGFLNPKRLTGDNLLFWYIPAIGCASYTAFSAHILNPLLLQSLCPAASRNTVANCMFFNSHLGIGLYLYNARHLSLTSQYYRVVFSIYGAVLFNFGSVLFWAVTKSILPHNEFLQTAYGIGSSICLLFLGRKYITHVDGRIKG